MTDKTKMFVMPGAELDDIDLDTSERVDLNFMEETEDQKAEREALEERKAARAQEIEDEKLAEADKKAVKKDEEDEAEKERLATEAAAKGDKKEELSDEEKAEAAKLEANRTEKDKGKKQPMVPKSRLDEVLQKNKDLNAQLEIERKAKASRQPEPDKDAKEFDFDTKETEYMKLVMEGETAKALAVRKEIRAAEQAQILKQTDTASSKDSEMEALAKAALVVEENFPQFVKGHAEYNEEATKVVLRMRDGLIATGSNAVEALNEAVDFAVRKFGLDKDLEVKDDKKVVNLDEKRQKEVEKKIAAQKKQPPEVKSESQGRQKEEKNEIAEMSDEEFEALPASAKARLRGDYI